MTAADTQRYIERRLAIAGVAQSPFAPDAIDAIYRYAGGIPRLVNILCGLALFMGFSQQQREIGRPQIVQAAEALRISEPVGTGGHSAVHSQERAGPDATVSTPSPPRSETPQAPPPLSDMPTLLGVPKLSGRTRQKGHAVQRGGRRGVRRLRYLGLAAIVVLGVALGSSGLRRLSERTIKGGETLPQPIAPSRTATPTAMPEAMRQPADTAREPQPTMGPSALPPSAPLASASVTQTAALTPTSGATSRGRSARDLPTLNSPGQPSPPNDDTVPLDTGPAPPPPEDTLATPDFAALVQTAESLLASGGASSTKPPYDLFTRNQPGQPLYNAITVQAGDTLGEIIHAEYGHVTPQLIAFVQKANPDIVNPSLIIVGQSILLPQLHDVSP